MGKSYLQLFVFVVLLLQTCVVSAQNRVQIDSLKNIVATSENNRDRAENLNELADLYSYFDVDSALLYANKAIFASRKAGYREEEAEAYYLLSFLHDRIGEPDKAVETLEKARLIFTELRDSSYLIGCYNNLGVLYSYGPDQKKSLECFITALNIAENLNETFALSEAYFNIGSFYEYLKEYSSALKYYTKALDIDIKLEDKENIALSHINIGNVNLKLQRLDIAGENLFKAQGLISEFKDFYRHTELYINMADYFLEINETDSAYRYLSHAKELNSKEKYGRLDTEIITLEGDYLLKKKMYAQSVESYNKAIQLLHNQKNSEGLEDIYLSMATAYSELGNDNKAYEMLKMAQKLKEDFQINEIAKILGEFEQIEAFKEEKAQLKIQQELSNQKNEADLARMRSRLQLAIFSIIILLFSVRVILYFYFEKRKHNKQLNNNFKTIREQKTLLEETNKNLEISSKKLAELNATKDKFFSIIAHDLKNPFNVLIGLSDIVISNPDIRHSEDFEQIIDGIFQTATSGYNLLDNLLEWARTQTGEMNFNPVAVDMKEIFELNTTFFREMATAKKIDIQILNKSENPVFGDFNMLNFIVRNILNNAIKFSYPGGVIEVSVTTENNSNMYSIRDFGVGMDEETIKKLFRIESAKSMEGTSNEKGTGLGLIICKEFIEKNGGKICVESALKKGSSFYFSLPVTDQPVDPMVN